MADADQGAESTRPSSSADGVTNVQGGGANSTANPASNDTAFVAEEAVGDSLWVRKWDEASNQLYYFNLRTQESSWDEPAAYKAVLMSEPINMDTERAQTAEGSVKDPQQDEGQHNSASVAIQSLYRGRKDRKRVEEARKWTEQFDPTTSQKYYYNSDTGESQWEKPVDFLVGIKDERSARAVKIQTVFRAKKARDRVKQLADEEEEEEDLKQQVRDVDEAVAAEEKKLAILTADRSDQEQWCEYYDPRSSKYYYRHSGTNEITWEKPEKYVSSSAEGSSKRDVAALSIQCAARKRIAAKDVASKREKLRVLTDPDTMQLKLDELKQVSVEIQAEIDHRTLVSMNEEQQFPHLSSLLSGWRESLESIKSHVVSLENRGEDIKMAECLAARLDHAERFHKSLAEMRSNCLALLRGILLMNSYFVDLDVSRINTAFATFAKWKSHELCALKDSRLLEILQGSDISLLLERAETLLRHAMGLTDFTTGTTSSTGKRYEDWHPSVAAAVVSIRELEESLEQKTQLLRGYRTAESRKKEISQMTEEDLLAARIVQMQRRRLNDEKDHAMFLVKCQEFWKKGLNQREEDIRAALGKSKTLRRPKHREVPQIDLSSGLGNDNKAKLSIWEATKEGLPVEAVRALVFAEMQKARRLGYDFLVKTSRSDHGETLIQIACWWGHTHLVKFFLEEGAQVDGVDSTCNRFSLLHDSARRGHSQVVQFLLEHGISCTATDSALDTPFHWAARKNNFSTVLILLGVYLTERGKTRTDEIIKAVRSKNLRGKTASALAKGERLRNTLKAAEEGRLPPLRRPRPASGISRRMTEVGTRSNTKIGKTMLRKATKHGSAVDIDELVSL